MILTIIAYLLKIAILAWQEADAASAAAKAANQKYVLDQAELDRIFAVAKEKLRKQASKDSMDANKVEDQLDKAEGGK